MIISSILLFLLVFHPAQVLAVQFTGTQTDATHWTYTLTYDPLDNYSICTPETTITLTGLSGVIAAYGPTSTSYTDSYHDTINLQWTPQVLNNGTTVQWTHVGPGTGNFSIPIYVYGFSVVTNPGAVNDSVNLTTNGFSLDSLICPLPDGYNRDIGVPVNLCSYTTNVAGSVVPYSAGSYTVQVTASDSTCPWTASSGDFAQITGGSGSAPGGCLIASSIILGQTYPSVSVTCTGSGTFSYSVPANQGPARTALMNIAGRTFTVNQGASNLTADISVPTGGTAPGDPYWITVSFNNNTGSDIQTIRPDCYNTTLMMTDPSGTIVPPSDWIRAYGIPADVVTIPNNSSFSVTCNLFDLFSPAVFPQTPATYKLIATYANSTQDPDWTCQNGACSCAAGATCYPLWQGEIASNAQNVTTGGTPVTVQSASAVFSPNQWSASWASSTTAPAITAQISGIATMPSNILLNGKVAPATPCSLTNGTLICSFDGKAVLQSIGSSGASANDTAVTVYPKIQGNLTQAEVLLAPGTAYIYQNAGLVITADKHTVGSGKYPGTTKNVVSGMPVRVYDTSSSCVANYASSKYGFSWQNYPGIWDNCPSVSQAPTDTNGQAFFDLPQGNYMVLGNYVDPSNSALVPVHVAVSAGSLSRGKVVTKYLKIIQSSVTGLVLPANYAQLTGSDILIIQPEYMVWDGTQALYPFVYDSDGRWDVVTSVTPPNGFVADSGSLEVVLNSDIKTAQFIITDVGSDWISTKVHHKVTHRGKVTHIDKPIGVKLSRALAKAKGIGVNGDE